MDPSQFDRLVRTLAQPASRRAALATLLGSALAGALARTPAAAHPTPAAHGDAPSTHERCPAGTHACHGRCINRRQKCSKQGPPCRTTGQPCQTNPECCTNQCAAGRCAPRLGCGENGSACQQNSDCCAGTCFQQRCAAPPTTCSGQSCPPDATGCCAGDGCCRPPANQCNTTGGQRGLCCAPNCAGRQCGPDGCGNRGTCGDCPSGQTCNPSTGQCQGQRVCTPQSCPTGCCANGVCQPGNTEQACGTGGQACVPCPGSKSTCQNGQCVCVPQCQGKQCGDDGCGNGGTCGSCPTGQTCNAQSGQCMPAGPCTAPFDNTCSCLAKVPGPGFVCTRDQENGFCSAANPSCPAGFVCAFSPCGLGVSRCVALCPSPAACTCDQAPEFCLSEDFVKCGNLTTSASAGTSTGRTAATRPGRSIFPRTP